jgi:hypothetical protein
MRSAVEATSLPEKNKAKAIGVVIADDHAMVRDGLRRLLEEANLKVLGEAKDGMEAVSFCWTWQCRDTQDWKRSANCMPPAT